MPDVATTLVRVAAICDREIRLPWALVIMDPAVVDGTPGLLVSAASRGPADMVAAALQRVSRQVADPGQDPRLVAMGDLVMRMLHQVDAPPTATLGEALLAVQRRESGPGRGTADHQASLLVLAVVALRDAVDMRGAEVAAALMAEVAGG